MIRRPAGTTKKTRTTSMSEGRMPGRPQADSFEPWQMPERYGRFPQRYDRSPNKPGLGWGQGGRWQQGPPRPHPIPQPQEPQGLSLNDQFQQFLQQDPSALGIASSSSLMDLMGDYAGGFQHGGQGYNQGSTMQQTIRNKFLDSLSQQDSLRAQNHMGYFTGGERVNAPQGGFQWTGSLPDLEPGESWDAQNQGVHYGSYSRGADGGYSWDAIGDKQGAYGVQPGTTTALQQPGLGYGRTRPRRRMPFMRQGMGQGY